MSKLQFSCLTFSEKAIDLLSVTPSETFSGASCPLFEWFEGGGCRNIFSDLSITALPQVLRVIDVFLRVLAVNNVEEPQESFALGSFS